MKASEFDDIELEYVGFWARVGASIIDTLLLGIVILPVVTAVYGTGYWLDGGFIKARRAEPWTGSAGCFGRLFSLRRITSLYPPYMDNFYSAQGFLSPEMG